MLDWVAQHVATLAGCVAVKRGWGGGGFKSIFVCVCVFVSACVGF